MYFSNMSRAPLPRNFMVLLYGPTSLFRLNAIIFQFPSTGCFERKLPHLPEHSLGEITST